MPQKFGWLIELNPFLIWGDLPFKWTGYNKFAGSAGAAAAKKAKLSPALKKGQTSILSFFKASPIHESAAIPTVVEASPLLKTRPQSSIAAEAASTDCLSEHEDQDIRYQ